MRRSDHSTAQAELDLALRAAVDLFLSIDKPNAKQVDEARAAMKALRRLDVALVDAEQGS